MLRINDVEDAILQARNRFNTMHKDIVKNYMEPYNELTKALILKSLNPDLKAELEKRIPDAMKDLNERSERTMK